MHTRTMSSLFTVEVPNALIPPVPYRCETKLGDFRLRLHDADPGITSVGIHFASGSAIFTHGTVEDTTEFFALGDGARGGLLQRTPWSLSDTTEVCEFGVRVTMWLASRRDLFESVVHEAAERARSGKSMARSLGKTRGVAIPRSILAAAQEGVLGLPDQTESVISEALLLAIAGRDYLTTVQAAA